MNALIGIGIAIFIAIPWCLYFHQRINARLGWDLVKSHADSAAFWKEYANKWEASSKDWRQMANEAIELAQKFQNILQSQSAKKHTRDGPSSNTGEWKHGAN